MWKNLIAAGRGYRWPALASAVLAVGLVIGIRPLVGDGGLLHDLLYWVFAGAAVGFLLMVLVGPARFRNDLRQDLMQIETIKAFPLSGAAIVLGEVLAPLILMTLLEWTLLALAAAAAPAWAAMTVHRWALPAAVLLPAWNLLSVVEQNGMALIFPSWVALGARRMAGLEAIGQGLLAAVARTLFLLVATLPSGVLFLGVLVFASAMGWPSPRLLAAIAAAVVLLVEAAAGVVLLGARFESFEIEELEARE